MKEKPILFSTPMVKALLEGKKTQTRRVINPQPDFLQYHEYKGKVIYQCEERAWCWGKHTADDCFVEFDKFSERFMLPNAPYQKGDILWVRETFGTVMARDMNKLDHYIYRADEKVVLSFALKHSKWKPSIFMPREAARLFLEVKSVRVERLQNITEVDANAEGISIHECDMPDSYRDDSAEKHCTFYVCSACKHQTLKGGYSKLWDMLNAKRGYAWESNPWVWVYEFMRVEK